MLIRECYESFFSHAAFSGKFRVIVTIDPAYGVSSEEIDETVRYLESLPQIEPRVSEVIIERLPTNIGLQRSLMLLFAHCRAQYGVHLEDDWRFFHPLDLDALLADLIDQQATMIAFGSTHVANGGTFERPGENVPIANSRVPLLRLVSPSWASDYIPLCPHLHNAERWIPTYVRALMLDDNSDRCPDERAKEYVRFNALADVFTVLWTRDIVVEDIGRSWAAERGEAKSIGAEAPRINPTLADGQPLELGRSFSYQERAQRDIPGQTQTFMKRPECFAPGAFPVFLDRGQGAYVWDVDGNAYIDFIAGLGACGLGHTPAVVTNAVHGQLAKGVLTSLPTLVEVEAAEAVLDTHPWADRIRFFKTGADACSAAVRLSRALTGRTAVASCGYHGWHELFTGGTPGVPDAASGLHEFDPFEENGPRSLSGVLAETEIACVLISLPYARTVSRQRMHALVQSTRDAGAVLVMDEIVTGFRLSLTGASGYFGIEPDLVCLGKSLAAGMPLAALAGSSQYMDILADLHVSTTYGGETLSLATAIATVGHYRNTDVIGQLHRLGSRFAEATNRIADDAGLAPIVHGYAPLPCFVFSQNPEEHNRLGKIFQATCARHGVLFRRDVNFITAAHGEQEVDRALETVRHGIAALASAPDHVR
ncbi:MAG: aminotransferase class III-fold pyridoxal phosphate-dependent enzyme [Alphaproteobacteria bacterium]